MINVSNAFLQKAKSTIRKPVCKINVLWTDVNVNIGNINVTSNSINYHHFNVMNNVNLLKQVANSKDNVNKKYAILDGSWTLGETFYLMPSTEEEALNNEIGYYSALVSNTNGNFSTAVILTVTFEDRSISALKVVGDSVLNQFPVDFDIKVYDNTLLLYTEEVRGNNRYSYIKLLESIILKANKIELIIYKWNVGNTVAKIVEFFTLEQDTFTQEDILSVNILKEIETKENPMSYGVISGELNLELQNIAIEKNGNIYKNPFFFENEDSPFRFFLTQGRKFTVYLGFDLGNNIEYVKMGSFWSTDWKCKEKTVTVTARDILDFFRTVNFECESVMQNVTATDALEYVFEKAKIDIPLPNLQYQIDSSLSSVTINNFWGGRDTYYNILNIIAEACNCYIYVNNEDIVKVVRRDNISQNVNLNITKDEYFDISTDIVSEIKNRIEVETQKFTEDTEESLIYEEVFDIGALEEKHITVIYPEAPIIGSYVSITEENNVDINILEENYFVGSAKFVFKNILNTNGTFKIEVKGIKYRHEKSNLVIAENLDSIEKKGLKLYKFPNNFLLQNTTIAENIAQNLLNLYSVERRGINLSWRGNPALEILDIINVQLINVIYKKYFITKQELIFNGGLSSNIEGIETGE